MSKLILLVGILFSFSAYSQTCDIQDLQCIEDLGYTASDVAVSSKINKNGPCRRFKEVRQCQNKRICRLVCSVTTGGLANGVCNEVCDIVPECSNVIVCVEYY